MRTKYIAGVLASLLVAILLTTGYSLTPAKAASDSNVTLNTSIVFFPNGYPYEHGKVQVSTGVQLNLDVNHPLYIRPSYQPGQAIIPPFALGNYICPSGYTCFVGDDSWRHTSWSGSYIAVYSNTGWMWPWTTFAFEFYPSAYPAGNYIFVVGLNSPDVNGTNHYLTEILGFYLG